MRRGPKRKRICRSSKRPVDTERRQSAPRAHRPGRGVTGQLGDVSAMDQLWLPRLHVCCRGFITAQQRDTAFGADAPEGSPDLHLAAVSTRDLRHWTPPTTAVAHARPGTASYATRRRTLCSHRSVLVIGATILEVTRSEADPQTGRKRVRRGSTKRGRRGAVARKRFTRNPPHDHRWDPSLDHRPSGTTRPLGQPDGFHRQISAAPRTLAFSRGT